MPEDMNMSESEICTAAFFRSLGKDLVSVKEFTISVFLDMQWMSSKTAPGLIKVLIQDGCIELRDGFIRPTIDTTGLKVPLDYAPSAQLKARAESLLGVDVTAPPRPAPPPPAGTDEEEEDVFGKLIAIASRNGMDTREFAKKTRALSKQLGLPPAVAGMSVLKEAGIDVSGLEKEAEKEILGRRSLLLGLDETAQGHSAGLTFRIYRGGLHGLVHLHAEGLLQLGDDLVVGDQGTVDDLVDGEFLFPYRGGEILHGHPRGLYRVADDLSRIRAEDGGLRTGIDVLGLHAPLAFLQPLLDYRIGGPARGGPSRRLCSRIVVFCTEFGAVHAKVHTDALDRVGTGTDVLAAHLALGSDAFCHDARIPEHRNKH